MKHFIGKILNKDIFTKNDLYLLSVHTVLEAEHIDRLIEYGITITERDIRDATPMETNQYLIDKIFNKMKEVFQTVTYSRTLPLSEIRKEILPAINKIVETPNFFCAINELQKKDNYTYTHNLSVSILSAIVGKWLGLSNTDIQILTIAGLLHDIGKSKITDTILLKPNKLSNEEFEEMKRHTIEGYEIIKNTIGASEKIALVALNHHEREDGNGYPNGLKGEKIDVFSKIVAICDVFDAMTSNRIYHKASPFFKVLKEMREDSFGKLDPQIMTVFIKKMMESIIGSEVNLSDGRKGKVIMLNPFDPLYPIVKIYASSYTEKDTIVDLNTSKIYLEKVV